MAIARSCWKCWGQECAMSICPLLYIILYQYAFNGNLLLDKNWAVRVILWLIYITTLLLFLLQIMNFLMFPPYYNEDAPEEHCHALDSHEKMQQRRARLREELRILRENLAV
ncbi:hypothetical protein F4811DRAFT_526992 [Daldinia bambusicola]|nr:hypothetical protein F4811DRAFT_526992 [Daldinia bambusicola]